MWTRRIGAMEGVWVACGKEMVCGAITGFHLGRPPNSAGVGPRGAVFGVARWLSLAAAPFMAPALWWGGGVGQIFNICSEFGGVGTHESRKAEEDRFLQ